MTPKFTTGLRALLWVCSGLLATAAEVHAVPAAETGMSVGNYTLIESRRVSRTEFEYTYAAQITNGGTDVVGVTATVTGTSPAISIIDGSVDFGDVAAGMTVPGLDTFRLRHNRLAGAFDQQALAWDLDFGVPGGTPASVALTLSDDVLPTAQAGGSVTASCRVLDVQGTPVPSATYTLSTDSPSATLNGTVFTFSEAGSFSIRCAADGTALMDSARVVVLDPAIDPAYGTFSTQLDTLNAGLDALVAADATDDVPAMQAAKDALQTTLAGMDPGALAAAPPLPADAQLPTPAQLLAAGDQPDPGIDEPYKDTVTRIEQNLNAVDALLTGLTATNITQADVDTLNGLTAELAGLADVIAASDNVSHTAILDVNDALNAIVGRLLPAQAERVAQLAVDSAASVPGVSRLDWQRDPRTPLEMYAGLAPDPRTPQAYAAQLRPASILPLPSVGLLWNARMFAIKKLYFPLMEQIARNILFLRTNNLGPFGLQPPILDAIAGPSLGNVVPGHALSVWGSGFAPNVADNQIEIATPYGTFQVPVLQLQADGVLGEYLLQGAPIPENMCRCTFGIPETGIVRVRTPGGLSNGVVVTVFP